MKPETTAFTQCGCGYYILLLHAVILVRIAAAWSCLTAFSDIFMKQKIERNRLTFGSS